MKQYFKIILKNSLLSAFFIFLVPLYSSAEAGKGIKDEAIILAIAGLIVIFVNQIYLSISSIKKIMNREAKSSVLHYISFVISIAIVVTYFPNKSSGALPIFDAFIITPLILGIISFTITIYNWVKKKKS